MQTPARGLLRSQICPLLGLSLALLFACDDGATAEPTPEPPPAFDRAAVAVRVVLPAGVATEDVAVLTGNSIAEVRPDGTSAVVLLDDAPQMAYVLHTDGRLVLLGVVGDGVTQLDARTSAEALVSLGAAAFDAPPVVQIALREALRDDPIVEPVAAAVTAAATAGGITDEDPALYAAVEAAALAIRRPRDGPPAGWVLPSAIISAPPEAHSGVLIEPAPGFNTIALVNQYRRRAVVRLERYGYVDGDGARHTVDPVPLARIELSPTGNLSFETIVTTLENWLAALGEHLGLLGDYDVGTLPWAPVRSDPIYLPLEPADARATLYRARIVGPGRPADEAKTPAEQADFEALVAQTLFKDIVSPLLTTFVMPLVGEKVKAALGEKVQRTLVQFALSGGTDVTKLAFGLTYFPEALTALQAGDFAAAFQSTLTQIFKSDTFKDQLLFPLLRSLIGASGESSLGPIRDGAGNIVAVNLNVQSVEDKLALFKSRLTRLTQMIDKIDKATQALDISLVSAQWAASKTVEVVEIEATSLDIELTPADVAVDPVSGIVNFTVTIAPGNHGESPDPTAYTYEWICSGQYGELNDGEGGHSGATFTTTRNLVGYTPNGEARGGETETLRVRVSRIGTEPGSAGPRVVGEARAIIHLKKPFSLSIAPPTGQVPANGSIGLVATLNEPLDDHGVDEDSVRYAWQIVSGPGTLTVSAEDGPMKTLSQVTFDAPADSATTVVEVRATVRTGGAEPSVVVTEPVRATLETVADSETLELRGQLVIESTFTVSPCGNCGPGGTPIDLTSASTVAWVVVPKVEGAASYQVTADGFDDPEVYGTSLGFGINPTALGDNQDRGGSYWHGLSGAGGPASDVGGQRAWMQARFGGLDAKVVVTLARP